MDEQRVRIRVIGPLEVADVDRQAFGSRRARTFVKVLAAARGQPVSPSRLAETLWATTEPPAEPSDQIAVLASRVRGVLGRDRIVRTEAGYALVVDWLDLISLDELEGEARRRVEGGQYAAARTAVVAALDLVRGPLFSDEPEAAWVDDERALFARRLAALHHTAAEAALAAGDDHLAVEQAQLALDADPYDEAALRLLMAGRVVGGRPASALDVYARFRARLRDDLGVDPSPETDAVHTSILREEPIPGLIRTPRRPLVTSGITAVRHHLPGRAAALGELHAARARVRVAIPSSSSSRGNQESARRQCSTSSPARRPSRRSPCRPAATSSPARCRSSRSSRRSVVSCARSTTTRPGTSSPLIPPS